MFMQSFENTDKQQQRRRSRQLAMERMERAANLARAGSGSGGSSSSNSSSSVVAERRKPVDVVVEDAVEVGFDYEPKQRDRPWRSNNGGATTSADDGTDDVNAAHSAMSVASASNFLRETQQQHDALRQHSSPRSPPASPSPSTSSRAFAISFKGRVESSKAARQFLWDESSVASGYSRNSNAVNLHDIKNSFASAASTKHSLRRNTGQAGRGARWSAIHGGGGTDLWSALPPLFGGAGEGGDSHSVASRASGRSYVDEEGQKLLNLAAERLESPGHSSDDGERIDNMAAVEEANDYGERSIEEEDDDSFTNEQGHRRIFLDKEGNLSYDRNGNGVDRRYDVENEDYSRRRRMNSYRRALKRPCVLACAAVGIITVAYGARGVYSRVARGMDLGRGFSGNVSVAQNGSDVLVARDDDWADSFHEELNSNASEEEQDAAAGVAASLESPRGEAPKEKLPQVDSYEEEESQNEGSPGVPNEELSALYKERFDHIRYALVNRGASPPEVFLDEGSAQYAALVWLTRDDPRRLEPESVYLGQRYGLAVLWFSTTKSGYEWHVPETFAVEGDEEDDDWEYEDDGRVDNEEYDDGDEWDDDEEVVDFEDNGDTNGQDDEDSDGTDYYEGISVNHYDETSDAAEPPPDRRLMKKNPDEWFRHDYWMGSMGVCGWEGVMCHPHENGNAHDGHNDGDVSHLELRRNNLKGLIPDELYRTLPYLKVLDLSDNGLAGTLSDELGGWAHLEALNLTSNNLAGSLPSAIDGMNSLKELRLANNLLGESIPRTMGSLTRLRHLDLSGNEIRGTIPYEVGRLAELGSLDLSRNLLVGPIPHELSELRDTLTTLDVSRNGLGGPLIAELCSIKYLETLRLDDNHFSGEVPTEIGDLVHLEELRMNNNDFRGTLPAEISYLATLDTLNIADNHFEGEFPPEWTAMAGLRELDISSNELRGEIPIFVDGMKNLRLLNMAHNGFSSTIPSELGSLYKLEHLYLDDNKFEGVVPKELGELTNMKRMALHNNYLIGQVDDYICKLANEMFLTQLSADCGGETPSLYCNCCICHDHEPMMHLIDEP